MTKNKYAELNKLLDEQGCSRVPKEIYEYAKTERSLVWLVCDVFNYGYIMGQRAERARRKGRSDNDA